MSSTPPILEHASREPVSDEDAYRLGELATDALCEAARARRDRAWGEILTFSPKVFLPITNLCRNRCDYCSFRRSPGDPGEWTMSPSEPSTIFDGRPKKRWLLASCLIRTLASSAATT